MLCPRRWTLVLAVLLSWSVGGAAFAETTEWLSAGGETVRIVRDDDGVPHIFAVRNVALFEAYGWVVAQDRLFQLEMNRRAARGRLSEVFGVKSLDADRFARSTGYTDSELTAQFAVLPSALQEALIAYARGINRYVQEVALVDPAKLPFELHRLNVVPAPWRVEDSVAFGAFMLRRFGEIGGAEGKNAALLARLTERHGAQGAQAIFDDLMWSSDPNAPVTISPAGSARRHHARAPLADPARTAAAGRLASAILPAPTELWRSLSVPSKLGSYAWVVASAKSADGATMLYGGPQMGFSAPEVVHEVQLVSDEGFNVVGMAFAGVPLVLIGRTPHLAWTSTTAVGDNVDIYSETLCDAGTGAASGTRFHDTCAPIATRVESIVVQGAPTDLWTVERSVHGPIVARDATTALAQKRAHWQREAATFEGFWHFDRATSLQEFAAGIPHIVTQHNFLYADAQGNIAYWQAGRVPVRAAGFDFRLPLPGDGSAEWTAASLPLPSSINPPQGYLANWNNKPNVDYPSADNRYFGEQSRLPDITARLALGQVRWDDMADIPRDIARVGYYGRVSRSLKPLLLAAMAAAPVDATTQAALELVRGWDGIEVADAVTSRTLHPAALLFAAWQEALHARVFDAALGVDAGAGIAADVNVLLKALRGTTRFPFLRGIDVPTLLRDTFKQATQKLTSQYGSDPTTWLATRPTTTFNHPLVGAVGTIPTSNRATYAQRVAFSPAGGVRAENIFGLGQSGFVASQGSQGFLLDPHFRDLLPRYEHFDYKPMRLLPKQP